MEIPIKTKRQRIMDIIGWAFLLLFIVASILLVFEAPETSAQRNEQFKMIVLLILAIPLTIIRFVKSYFTSDYNGRIKIDSNGVDFSTKRKHVFMSWDDIAYVVITKGFHIRFFTSQYQNKKNKMPYDEYPRVDIANVTEDYIYMPYSEEALAEVKKYSRNEVVNEYILYLKRNSL